MPLDPQARALVDKLTGGVHIDPEKLTPEVMRLGYEAISSAPPGEPVAASEDLTLPGPEGGLPARLFKPVAGEALPVLLYFHGGGWVAGSIDTHDGTCRKLANAAGCAVLSVGYRLAPEAKFPAAPEDCYAALCWLSKQGGELGLDTSRIAIGGDSAGGNLAAVTSILSRDRGGPELRYQVLLYPVTDRNFETASYREGHEDSLLSSATMRWFWGHYLSAPEDGESPLASPLRAESLAGLPPAHVITAEADPLRDEGRAYAGRLREAGVPTRATHYEGAFHGFFSMSDELTQAKRALAEVGQALRGRLGA